MKRRCAITLFLVAASPALSAAQAPRDAACTYASCALRLEGGTVVAGLEGREVTSFGFLDAPEFRPWAATSDSAAHYISVIEENYVSGRVLTLSGVSLLAVGLLGSRVWEGSRGEWVGLGIGVVGHLTALAGLGRQRRARDATESLIWWYNGALSDDGVPGSINPDGVGRPVRVRGHHGRTGALLGSLAGLGAGLWATRDQASFAPGLGVTLAGGALGGLLGWSLGSSAAR